MSNVNTGQPKSLRDVTAQKEAAIRAYLPVAIKKWWSRECNPERLKAVSRIASRLRDIQRLHNDNDANETLLRLVEQVPTERNLGQLDFDTAWELSDSLNQELLRIADDAYLRARLEMEWRRDKACDGGRDQFSWSSYFPTKRLTSLHAVIARAIPVKGEKDKPANPSHRLPTPAELATARRDIIRSLTLLYDQRTNGGRNERTLAKIRGQYLIGLTVMLLILMVGACLIMIGLEDGGLSLSKEAFAGKLLAAIAAGALGSTFGGVMKLKNDPIAIRELRGFTPMIIAMPMVGATAGMILYVLLKSGLVQILNVQSDKMTWTFVSTACFLAGFSEPFFLGTITKLSGGIKEGGAAPPKPGGAVRADEDAEDLSATPEAGELGQPADEVLRPRPAAEVTIKDPLVKAEGVLASTDVKNGKGKPGE